MDRSTQFSEYFRILFRGRWVIVLSFLTVVAAAAFLTYRMRPEYTAVASVLILNEDKVEDAMMPSQNRMIMKSRNLNEMEILRSRKLAEDVLRTLADSPYKGELEVMQEKTKDGLPISFDQRVYNFREKITVENIKDTDVLKIHVNAYSAFEAAFLANAIAEEYYRYSLRTARGEISDIRQFLEQQLTVVREQLSQSEELERRYKESQGVASLDVETSKMVTQAADFHALYNQTETDLNAQLRKQDYLKNQLAETKGSMVEDVTKITSPLIESLQKEIADKQTKIASLMSNRGPGTDITIAALEREIESVKGKLIEEVRKIAGSGIASIDPIKTSQELFDQLLTTEGEIKALTAKADAFREVVASMDNEMSKLPEKSLVLAQLARDRLINENLYKLLNEKFEEARITEAGKSAHIQILDTAKPPIEPYKPNKVISLLLGMVMGLGLGVVIAFVMEYLDDTVKTGDDIERMKLVTLGSIPVVHSDQIIRRMKQEGKKFTPSDLERVESKLITRFSPKSPVSEAYRSLRTNIQFSDIDNPKRVLLMTSAASKEGKSTTCTNLAITLAQTGSKVLLVDSDLRRPAVHNFFNMDKTYGLTNVLIGSLAFDDVIKKTEVDNLDVITAGDIPPNPSELVASEAMRMFLKEARAKYDYVLLDSPPVIAVTDAAILATRVDGAILVVGSGHVSKREIERAVSLIRNVGTQVMGIVVNALDIKRIYGSYYYYFHYYQYYYYYGSDKKKTKRRHNPVNQGYEGVT